MSIRFSQVRVAVGQQSLLQVHALELREQRISVIGPNGGGKSTLLQLVNGLIDPTEGYVTVNGRDTIDHGSAVRRRAGFLFANPAAQLIMPTPVEDVELSLRSRIRSAAQRREAALDCLRQLRIEELAERSSHDISAGQQQLVALATVFALKPDVLLLDEPTTLLDLINARRFTHMVDQLCTYRTMQVITATHDLDLAAEAERCLMVEGGQVVADGPPAEVIAHYRTRSQR